MKHDHSLNHAHHNNPKRHSRPPGCGENASDTLEGRLLTKMRESGHFLRYQMGGKLSQRRILSILQDQGTISQRELMEMLHVQSGSLSEMLSKVEQEGFINRNKNEQDKRNVDIMLTEAGKTMALQMNRQHGELIVTLFDGLSEDEKVQLVTLLDKLLHHWKEK